MLTIKNFVRKWKWIGSLALLVLILAACQSAAPTTAVIATEAPIVTEKPTDPPVVTEEPTALPEEPPAVSPSVKVEDQAIENGTVVVADVVSAGPGWLVIHAQAEGKPGPILGFSPVVDGNNQNVLVEIESAAATETLYAMLHVDAGEIGQWEFPDGPDAPVKVDEKVVTPPFKVLAAMTASEPVGDMVVSLSSSEELGAFLVDADGMTLYLFTKDDDDITNFYDQCAENWPPLMLADGQSLLASEGVIGELGTTERNDGGTQVTYNGMPLYYWIKDAAPGDTTGHGVGSVWAVVGPETQPYIIDPSESEASYEVGEVFLEDNRFFTAIGVTSGVNGKIYLDLSNPLASLVSPIDVDISQFTSDSQRRDNKIRSDFLESSAYPIATFAPKQIDGLPETYNEGEMLTLQISGDLTIKEVTKSVTFEVTGMVQDGIMSGEASTIILMSDFGVGPISILGILETEDEVKINFSFAANP